LTKEKTDSDSSSRPPLPEATEQPYIPSALTVEDLLPDVPATAVSIFGLESALIRETEGLRKGKGGQFAGYQRRRGGVMKTVVEGRYEKLLGLGKEGTVLEEARRLVARNGTIPNAAKTRVLAGVKEFVGEMKLAAPEERAKLA
jgi:hypothetical protein